MNDLFCFALLKSDQSQSCLSYKALHELKKLGEMQKVKTLHVTLIRQITIYKMKIIHIRNILTQKLDLVCVIMDLQRKQREMPLRNEENT